MRNVWKYCVFKYCIVVVMCYCGVLVIQEDGLLYYQGCDMLGCFIEVVVVEVDDGDLIIIYVMLKEWK